MLTLVKYCAKVVGRDCVRRPLPSYRSFITSIPKIPLSRNGCLLMKRNPVQLQKGVLTKSSTLVLNYASRKSRKIDKIVGTWLFTCSGMVFVAVVLGTVIYAILYYSIRVVMKVITDKTYGGVTRLTESGLSMVTWKLLGEKMPTNEAQWISEFERYKQFPEFKINNKDMTLEEFKRIWWMEYLHRTWGRLIGGVFLLPAVYFWSKGMLKPAMKIRALVLGALIGLQGLMGWYMVKSGLEDRFHDPSDVPRVSQYRLAAHLGLAFIIYTGFLYNALEHISPAVKLVDQMTEKRANVIAHKMRKFRMLVHSTKGLIFLTAVSGAFVAGMDAGLIYNTFPKMAGKWIPDDILALSPTLKNFTENPTTVQFDHRVLGISTITLILLMASASRKYKLPGYGSEAVAAVVCAGCLQVLFGISTLLQQVPTALAACHQSGSLILLSSIIWLCHEIKHLKKIPK